MTSDVAMPRPLRVAMVAGALVGSLGSVAGLWVLVGVLARDGTLVLDGVEVERARFLQAAVPLLALYLAACTTALVAAWALWRGRSRSRALLTLLLVELVVGDVVALAVLHRLGGATVVEVVASSSFFVVAVALCLWYLYAYEPVVAYYRRLGGRT